MDVIIFVIMFLIIIGIITYFIYDYIQYKEDVDKSIKKSTDIVNNEIKDALKNIDIKDDKLKKYIDNTISKINDVDNSNKVLLSELNNTNNSFKNLQKENKEYLDTLETNNAKIENIQSKHKYLNDRMTNTINDAKSAVANLNDVKTSTNTFSEKITDLNNQDKSLDNKIITMQAKQIQYDGMNNTINGLQNSNNNISTKISSIEEANKILYDNVQKYNTKISDLNVSHITINNKLNNIDKGISDLRLSDKLIDGKINETNTKVNTLDSQYQGLNTNLNNIKSKVSTLEQNTIDYSKNIIDEQKMNTRLNGIETNITNINNNNTSLSNKFGQLGTQVQGIESKNNALYARVDGMNTKIDTIYSKVDNLNNKVSGIDGSVKTFDTKLQDIDSRIQNLQNLQNTQMTGIVSIVCSAYSTVYLEKTGKVLANGHNNADSKGLGITGAFTQPGVIYAPQYVLGTSGTGTQMTGIVKAVCSNYNTVYLENTGKVLACGYNSAIGWVGITGTLTTNGTVYVSQYVLGTGGTGTQMTGIVSIVCSNYHTVYLEKTGKVLSSGTNNADTNSSSGITGTLTTNGRVYVSQYVLGTGGIGTQMTGIVSIVCSNFHTVYLENTGKVLSCGPTNGYGASGTYTTSVLVYVPRYVLGTNGTGTLTGIVSIACSDYSTVYLENTGRVLANGHNNADGQQGLGITGANNTLGTIYAPRYVLGTNGTGTLTGIISIVCSAYSTVYLEKTGKVLACGNNNFNGGTSGIGITGTLSTNTIVYVPQYVLGTSGTGTQMTGIVSIVCSGYHIVYLENTGKVLACGHNNADTNSGYGITGTLTRLGSVYVPQYVLGTSGTGTQMTGIVSIVCSQYHTVYLENTGKVLACGGTNGYGMTGTLTSGGTLVYVPQYVLGTNGMGTQIQQSTLNTLNTQMTQNIQNIQNLDGTVKTLDTNIKSLDTKQNTLSSSVSGALQLSPTNVNIPSKLCIGPANNNWCFKPSADNSRLELVRNNTNTGYYTFSQDNSIVLVK